jgi:hypothetical protein
MAAKNGKSFENYVLRALLSSDPEIGYAGEAPLAAKAYEDKSLYEWCGGCFGSVELSKLPKPAQDFLVVHVPGLASAHRWALPEARHGQQSTRPAPDAVPLFPPSFEHAFYAARGCVCPPGAPRAPSLIPSTLPWTFGQGRTHASGWRYDSRTDPPDGARPDLAADAQATPQRPAGITTPMAAEMHGWAGSTRFVFKIDRVGWRVRAGQRNNWVGAATPWSRGALMLLTTDRHG